MFVGRDRELGVVGAHLRGGRPVAVVGPVGMGKSSLASVAASAAPGRVEVLVFLRMLSAVPFGGARRWIADLGTLGDEAAAAERVVAELRRGGGGALVLDDLQWADPQSVTMAMRLAGKVPLVATVRSSRDGRLEAELAGGGFEVVELGGLGDSAARELVAGLSGDWSEDEVELAVSRAGGNPLLCTELAAGRAVPGEIETWLQDRLDGLGSETRRALCLLALLGRPATAADVDAEALELLVDAEIAGRDGEGAVAIRHGLLAELALQRAEPEELARLHGVLADRMVDADEALVHAAAAGRSAEVFAAAWEAAAAASAMGSRAAYMVLAARHAPAGDRGSRIAAATAAIAAGEAVDALDALGTLADADACGPDWALLYSQALWETGARDRAHAVLDAELERLGPDDADAVPLLGQRALLELFEVPASASGMEMASRAISLGDATGTPAQRARLGLGFTRCVFGAPNWSELLETALAESEVADDIPVAWWAREALVVGTIFSGQVAEARAMADEGAALVGTHRYLKRQRLFETYSAIAALFLGRYGDVLTGTARLLRSPCDTRTLELVKLARALALIDVGADAEAREQLRSLDESGMVGDGSKGTAKLMRAESEFWGGHPAKAVQDFESAFESLPAFHFYAPLGSLAHAWAALEAGTSLPGRGFVPPVGLLADVHAEWEGLESWSGHGPSERVVDLLEGAAETWSAKVLRNELRCRWGAGEAARLCGDLARAETLLRLVEQQCLDAGMGPLLWRARRSLRQAGLLTTDVTDRPSGGPLTPSERKVLDVARTGASNAEIARRLGLSRSTVTYHFRRIEAKLGTDSRHGAVRTADRQHRPPLVVVRGDGAAFEATLRAMRSAGWTIADAATGAGGSGPDPHTLTASAVRERADAQSALLVALSGGGVVVHVEAASELAGELVADLRRIGSVEVRGEGGERLGASIGVDEQALLDLLAAGVSATEAARRVGWSRRTAFRRLAMIREVLGVETTSDAVAAYVGRTDPL